MMILLLLLMMMICLGLAALQWSHEASKSTAGENKPTGDQDGVFPVQSCDQPERDQYKCGRNIRMLFHLVLIHYLCIELIFCWYTHTLMWVMRQVLFKTMFLCPLEILQIHLESKINNNWTDICICRIFTPPDGKFCSRFLCLPEKLTRPTSARLSFLHHCSHRQS